MPIGLALAVASKKARPTASRRSVRWSAYAALITLAISLGLGGCSRMLRYSPIDPTPGELPAETLIEGMNPFLLTDLVTKRVVVEVDWVEGNAPDQGALDALGRIIGKYGPSGRPFAIERGGEFPASRFPDVVQTSRLPDGVLRHAPRGSDEFVHVLYVEECGGPFGFARPLVVATGSGDVAVPAIVMCMGPIRKEARLTITPQEIERATLVHEFGHLLGLVSNERHAKRGAAHECANVSCLVTHPTLRSVAANLVRGLLTGRLPTDFCAQCQQDIRRAQAAWAARAAGDPTFTESLLKRRRAEDALARGNLARREHDTDQAISRYREALVAFPHNAALREVLANLLAARGDAGEAVQVLQRTASPRTEAVIVMGFCASGQYEAAALRSASGDLLRVGAADPAWSYPAVAWALAGSGRLREAAETLASVPPRPGFSDPDEAHRAAADLFRRSGDVPRAQELIQKAEGGTADATWLVVKARLEIARGENETARSDLREAASRFAGDDDLGRRGHALALAGDRAEALAALEAAAARVAAQAENSPHGYASRVLRANQARTLAVLGDVEGALAVIRTMTANDRIHARFDPCLDEDLAAALKDERAREVVPWCFERHLPGQRNGTSTPN